MARRTLSEVGDFAQFCSDHLVQSEDQWEGQPLLLEPWQVRMMRAAMEYDAAGEPLWRSVVLCVPRKNGKTQLLAAVALYRLLTTEGRPEILLAASSDSQAGRLFDAASRFVRRSPLLASLVRVRDHAGELAREDGMGIIYRLSSDPKRLHGYNPTLVVADELAQWTTPTLRRAFAALTSGGGARTAPQVFTITTAGEAHTRPTSILGRMLDQAEVATDQARRPGLLVARMPEAHMLVWAYSAPTEDPHDVRAMKLANPATWITKEYLAKQAANPELSTADVLQLHGCVWAEAENTWLPAGAFAATAAPRQVAPGTEVVLGFDGSYRHDSTALVGCTLDGYLWPVAVWEKPERAAPEWKVPRTEVHAAVAQAMEQWDVLELACDPPGWHSEIDEWGDSYGGTVVAFDTNQRTRMAPACDRFRAGVLEGGLTFDGSAVLVRHMAHCVAKETPTGTVITKAGETHKIDAAVAAVIAYDRACWHAGTGHAWVGWGADTAPAEGDTEGALV